MILGIKTDSDRAELYLLREGQVVADHSWGSGRKLSSELLDHIEAILKKNNGSWKDISGLIVFRGPGSFTGLRIGVTVANTIAYAQSVPIVGQAGADWLKEGAKRIVAGKSDTQVVPEYGSPPNITKPKT